ncbi:MAG: hypothetical protein AMXMBFR13_49080 [Phycisphaerae bacterium]
MLFRNRFAIAVASLVWLVWRSGSQPRRLAYPCQQAAAANLGFLSVLFIPSLVRGRLARAATPRARAFVLVSGSMCLAGVLFLLGSAGIAVYSDYAASQQAPAASSSQGTGVPAMVSIVKDTDGVYTEPELRRMVREAVRLAGGLEPLMVDTRGGGAAPWTSPDGDIDVIILPNMSGLQPGLNTDPRITRMVVDLAWEAGADSVKLGGAATGDNWTAFRDQGYDANSDHLLDYDTRVPLIDLNDTGTTGACAAQVQYNNVTPITLPTSGVGAGVARTSYYVHNELLKADVMIVVPCIKNHDLGTVTLGMKMRIGTAPQDIYFAPWLGCGDEPFLRWEMHNVNSTRFPWTIGAKPGTEPECVQRSLVDLNLVRPHDFVVLDALVGCESGPLNYDEPSARVKSIMASRDTLALDTIASLVMGYDADRIPCLNMANDTQSLGVKDRRLISVVGNHVQDTRVNFSTTHSGGYATVYRSESVPPVLGGISLVEGQPVVADPTSTIACTGVGDNVGVIKAELSLKRTNPSNLLANGGFEDGAAGWSIYHSNWGGNSGVVDFNSTQAGRVGTRALHLSVPNGQADSFAVYQEVPVTPGQAYRLNAYWKGEHYGHDTWYEVMLIDGPWDVYQADTGGSAVLLNHMFAYDTNPSPTCGAGGNPITSSFGWTWTHTQYGANVDNCWNDRDGVRVATGNTMTVVLKAGSCCDTKRADVWFDEVSLTQEAAQDPIVVATVPDPGSDFDIVWDSTGVPLGKYEATVTVYDAMMNDARLVRNIEIVQPATPLISVDPIAIERTIYVGSSCSPAAISVANAGIDTLNYTIAAGGDWLAADPATGLSSGYPSNPHAVLMACEDLPPGDHTEVLTISDPLAYNSPQQVTVTIHVQTTLPDFDLDGDVDLDDFGSQQTCLGAPGVQVSGACAACDLDGDGDCDGGDVTRFRECFNVSGPNVIPPETCDDNMQ